MGEEGRRGRGDNISTDKCVQTNLILGVGGRRRINSDAYIHKFCFDSLRYLDSRYLSNFMV